MTKLAKVKNGIVADVIVGTSFPGYVPCDDNVSIGWLYDGGVFTAPPVPEAPRDVPAEVAQHVINLKVGIVNATRIDGLTDPSTSEGLSDIMTRYQRITDEFNTDVNLGDTVSEARKDVVRLIRDGHAFFQTVDAAASTILEAGDAADPIDSDVRWPSIPSEE